MPILKLLSQIFLIRSSWRTNYRNILPDESHSSKAKANIVVF